MKKEELIDTIIRDIEIQGNLSLEYNDEYRRILEHCLDLKFTHRNITIVYRGDDYLGSSYDGDWIDSLPDILENMDEIDLLFFARKIQKETYGKVYEELGGGNE